jgi:hypothetical protein
MNLAYGLDGALTGLRIFDIWGFVRFVEGVHLPKFGKVLFLDQEIQISLWFMDR